MFRVLGIYNFAHQAKQEHKRCLDYCPKYSTWFMKPPWQNYRDNFTRTLLLVEINSEGKFLFFMLLDFLVWYCTHIVLTDCINLSFVLVHSSVIEHMYISRTINFLKSSIKHAMETPIAICTRGSWYSSYDTTIVLLCLM